MIRTPRTPSYRLHKPSGQAVVTLGGRDVYLGLHGSRASRVEYDRVVAEWLANGRQHVSPDRELSISRLILAYWEHAEGHYVKDGRATSELSVIKLALRPLRRLYGSTPVTSFGPLALKAVRQAYISAGYKRNVVNGMVSRIRRLFRWASENELAPAGVHHALATVTGLRRGRGAAKESTPITPVPDAHVEAIRPYVSRQVWAMIQVQLLTGMRPSEVCLMRWCDIDTGGAVWVYRPAGHKTEHHGRERVITLGPRARTILNRFGQSRLEAFVFSPVDAEAERSAERRAHRKTPLSANHLRQYERPRRRQRRRPPRDHYDCDSYRRAIHRGCDKADAAARKRLSATEGNDMRLVPRWSPHRLRHNHATEVRRLYGLEAAQVALGHATANVTQLYAERDLALAERVALEIG